MLNAAGHDESEAGRVQHDLYAGEHHDEVAPREQADEADHEKDGGQDEAVIERHGRHQLSSPSPARSSGSSAESCGSSRAGPSGCAAMWRAPMSAASSSIEASSTPST